MCCGRHPDAEASVPAEIASPCTQRIGNQSGRSGVAALVRGPSRFSLLRPRNAFDSTARVAWSPRRAGHLVQQPGCITRPRRHGLDEGLDQHRSTRRTGSCRCPTTLAGPLHAGTTERLPRPCGPPPEGAVALRAGR